MEENIDIPLTEPDISNESTPTETEVIPENGAGKFIIENCELAEKLKDCELQIASLKDELSNKTDVIIGLEKQKSSFEKEVTHVSFHLILAWFP